MRLSFFGGASWIRTSDTRIFSPLLYQLSYGTFFVFYYRLLRLVFYGGASWIRTSDTRIFSPLLYQLSYGTFFVFYYRLLRLVFFGGASWIRTSDTRIFSPLLYQLSYGTFSYFIIDYYDKSWRWCQLDSNQRHKDFQSFALPTELWHLFVFYYRLLRLVLEVVPAGFEPATQGFSVLCSTN